MELTYGDLKERAAAVAAAFADTRSARNLLSRRKTEAAMDEKVERQADRARRRQRRKNERELEELLRRKVRVWVPVEQRPRVARTTARNLYHRAAGMLLGVTGLTDARGPDGLYSIHFAFTARGFASTKGRRWRRGEAERAARYITREEGLECGELGWWSSIADDRNELVAFYRAVEALERHDRSNANVYVSEVIALPAELSARQRRRAVRRICRFFDKRGLPYTVAIHLPDASGDQRNYHCHIVYSLRPCERIAPYEWSFGVAKADDINTPDGIMARRVAAVRAINKTLNAAGIAKRYTHLSNKARRMAAAQGKLGQQRTWAARRLAALEERVDLLRRVETGLQQLIGGIGSLATRLHDVRAMARQRLAAIGGQLPSGSALAVRLTRHGSRVSSRLAAAGLGVGAIERTGFLRTATAARTVRARLIEQVAVVAASSDGLRLRQSRAVAAGHLARAKAAMAGVSAGQHRRLRQAAAGAQRWFDRSAGEVVARGHAPAALLATRQSALAATLERLGQRAASARANALTVVMRLGSNTKLRSDQNRSGRIKLAGMGAVARLREEAIRRRLLVKAIDTCLSGHKVLLGRTRVTAAGAAAKMGDVIASTLEGTRVRLAATGRVPRLVRSEALGRMLSALDDVRRATPGRLQAAQERAQNRMTGTINQISWTIRGAEAGLRDVQHEAVRVHRIDLLTVRSATVKEAMGISRDRLVAASEAAALALAERLVLLRDSLAGGKSRLGQTNETMQRRVQSAESEAIRTGRTHDMTSRQKSGPDTAVAAPRRVDTNAAHGLPASKPVNKRSKTEDLRKLVPTRTPETDLHGRVLPSDRGPRPDKKPSTVTAMWQRLRGEARHRQTNVNSKLLQQALRRLATSKAIITRGENGMFVADDRGLFDEERRVLRRAAGHDRVQAVWPSYGKRRKGAANRLRQQPALPPNRCQPSLRGQASVPKRRVTSWGGSGGRGSRPPMWRQSEQEGWVASGD